MGKKTNYFMGLISGMALVVVAWVVFSPGFNIPLPINAPGAGSGISAQGGLDMVAIGEKLNHIYQIIEQNYIGEFDLELALDMMFTGFVYAAGDPYTVYMNPENFTAFMEDTDGNFVGIGVSVNVDTTDNTILVISPFDGSPAAAAGVLPGDKIIRVDGIPVFGNTLREAITMIRGEIGTEVVITILRESNNTTFDLTIVRETINVETVRYQVFAGNIGYIRISQFDRLTYDQFRVAYEDLMSQGVGSLIIDVRNNPGGLLTSVNRIANMIVPEGIIMYIEDAQGNRQYIPSNSDHIEIPLIVLVNGNSASASEVLSGAVRDTGVGELLGTTTFGKGLVQSVFNLSDGAAVKVTIARYYTPAGISIHGDGIIPDHYVEMPQELTNTLSSLAPEMDIQLQEAIRILQGN